MSIRYALVTLVLALSPMLHADAPPDRRVSFRIEVTATGSGETTFTGSFAVNGREVVLGPTKTPWQFKCEAGQTIKGRFQTVDGSRRLRVRVYDYAYSNKKPSAEAKRLSAVAFEWAEPGVGPRTVKETP